MRSRTLTVLAALTAAAAGSAVVTAAAGRADDFSPDPYPVPPR